MKSIKTLALALYICTACAFTAFADIAPMPVDIPVGGDEVSPVVLAFCCAALTLTVAFVVRKIVRKKKH